MRSLMNKLGNPAYYLSLLFVFLIFLNFRDIPDRYAVLGACACCLFYFVKQKKLRVDLSIVLLGVSIALYGKMQGFGMLDFLLDAILVASFMLFGKYILVEARSERECILPAAIFLSGYSLYGVLNSVNYFFYPFEIGGNRTWPEFWTGQNLLATQQCIYIMPLLAMIVPAIVCWKKNKAVYSLTIITVLFFLYHSLITLSRTPIMAFAVLVAWEILLFLLLNRHNKKLMKITKWTVVVCTITIAVFLLLNWGWIQEIPFVQNMGKDGGVLNNIRFRAQRSVLKQLFNYPMGNPDMYTEGMKMVHNVWLDMAKKTGLFPFGLFSMYTLITFAQMIKMLRGNVSAEFKYLLSGIYLAYVLYYTVEPALDANIRYMVPWTFINGLIAGCNNEDFMKEKEIFVNGSF